MKPGHYKGIFVLKRLCMRTKKSKEGCLLFQGAKSTKSGYCKIWHHGRRFLIHRLSYQFFVGDIPPQGKILHRCVGHPNCWNPAHLYAGTQKENVRDCREQGRMWDRRGERNGLAKLTEKAVKQIRRIPLSLPSRIVGERFKISSAVVRKIRQRKTWTHV